MGSHPAAPAQPPSRCALASCAKEFVPKPHASGQRFCSTACGAKWRTEQAIAGRQKQPMRERIAQLRAELVRLYGEERARALCVFCADPLPERKRGRPRVLCLKLDCRRAYYRVHARALDVAPASAPEASQDNPSQDWWSRIPTSQEDARHGQ